MLWKMWFSRYWLAILFGGLLMYSLFAAFMASQHTHEGCCDWIAGAAVSGFFAVISGFVFLVFDVSIGGTYAYFKTNEKGEGVVEYSGSLDEDRLSRAQFAVRIGDGWFRRSYLLETRRPTRFHPMPVLAGECDAALSFGGRVLLRFRDGILRLKSDRAVHLLHALPELSEREHDLPSSDEIVRIILELQDEQNRLQKENEERRQHISALVDAVTETVRTLSNTKRVGKSTEARRIKDEVLLPTLDRHLAPDDPRRGEFGIKVYESAVEMVTSTLATGS